MELRETREESCWKVELVAQERSLSRLWVADRLMRIGRAVVKVGGIAGVGTEPEYRNQGLARRVLEAAARLMEREGYEASFLFGIHDFYHRFGYSTCMPEHDLRLETREAERAQPGLRMRAARKADLPQLLRVYARGNDDRTASVVRPPSWGGFRMGSGFFVKASVQVAVDQRDRVRGYLVYDEVANRSRAAEVGGAGEEVFGGLMRFLARRAVSRRCEEVSASIPPDHPFTLYARQFGCRVETRSARNGGPMGRIVLLEPFMVRILPELERRWGIPVTGKPLGITTDIGSCALVPDQGRLRLLGRNPGGGGLRLSQEALMQLLLGYYGPEDLIAMGRLRMPASQLALARRLFPPQQAHMWWPDRF
jgi:predicted acetyltransferase